MTATPDAVPAQRSTRTHEMSVQELLDAMPDATAVLDEAGTIIAVNRAWRMFTLDNGGSEATTGVGTSYLDVCARSAQAGCNDATDVLEGLRSVLRGETVQAVLDYPCPSPEVGRWFALRVSPVAGASSGVLVTHTNITRQKTAELDLERRASQDPLTGLANRTQFDEHVQQALAARHGRRPRAEVGILFLDLDGFKPVNDTYGHAAGDEVLQAVANRLRSVVRPDDSVARLGGDEFAVVAGSITADELSAMARRITQALDAPHQIQGRPVVVGVSIGACLVLPDELAAQALHRADEAMYAAKHRARAHR